MELDTKPHIFKSENIILDNITFKKSYSVGKNIFNMPIKYLLKDLIIQTPIIYIPFGINSYNNKKYLDISLLNIDNDIEMKNFKKFICSLNEIVSKKIKSKKGRKMMRLKSSLKKTTNNFFPDRVRLSISESILVFNDFKRKISFDCIQPKLYSKMLISPKCVWFSSKEFGIVWNILQVKIYDRLILDEYSFIDENVETPKIKNISQNKGTLYDYENDERYKKYFRMIKMGVPKGGVQHKMVNDGLDPSILDYNINQKQNKLPEHTNKNNILNEICNKITLNKIKPQRCENNKKTPLNITKNIITKDMILGVKLNKSKPVKKTIVNDNKHFNPLISLDEIKSIRKGLTKIK